jgi:hypothetical protein
LISVSQQPKPNISLIIITDTPETGPTHQQDHIEQNNTVQGDTGSKTASEECTCMYVKSAKITVAKPYSTAARQMAIQKMVLEASWTSKGKRVFFWR